MEINDIKDEYLRSLYLEKELHEFVIANARKVDQRVVARAKQMLATTEERIRLREYMIEKGLT